MNLTMPKAKVLVAFRDKTDNLKVYNKGDVYEHEDNKRITTLVKSGYLEKSKQPPKEKK